jgi:thioredoxin reductase
MTEKKKFDVIIIGGSYAGLAAGMALGRALKEVLIIDGGKPCNRQTPHSHNFITHDEKTPTEIATLARRQVEKYDTVNFLDDMATGGAKTEKGFEIQTASRKTFSAKKVIFATGIRDIMSGIGGYAECWGISVLHCPYCHGYEVRNERTGILGNGDYGFEFSGLISNWTKDLTLFTNGPSTLTREQTAKIKSHNIKIVQTEIEKLKHIDGHLEHIIFKDGTTSTIKALYARSPFEQHSAMPSTLGCELTEDGYINVDTSQKTTVHGLFACGDNTSRMRSIANAVAMGTVAGMMANKEIVMGEFTNHPLSNTRDDQ